MKARAVLISALFLMTGFPAAAEKTGDGPLTWARTYGGSGDDFSGAIVPAVDGGYMIAGTTESFGAGSKDVWVVKIDEQGTKVWDRTCGGPLIDSASWIERTDDGGYVVAGTTWSGRGKSYHGDVLVIKLDREGDEVWKRKFGGNKNDWPGSIVRTSGGYIIAGATDMDFLKPGSSDIWLVELDGSGRNVRDRKLGGRSDDVARSIQRTDDDGYIIAAETQSYGKGDFDIWLIRLDRRFSKVWERTFGGQYRDKAVFARQTEDGGYILLWNSRSFEGTPYAVVAARLDAGGNVSWQEKVGGMNLKSANHIIQTADRGYIVAGSIMHREEDEHEAWIIKLDAAGRKQWERSFGGKKSESAAFIMQTADGGYLAACSTKSFGAGGSDMWVLKLDSEGRCEGCFQ